MSDVSFRDFNDIIELAEYLKIDILPQAEALIPINPIRWLAHAVGSIVGQDLQNADSLVAKPFTNLAIAKQYLGTAHNRSHFCRRASEVGMDTLDINALSEWSVVGNAASGTYANWAANKYRIQMEDNRLPSNSTVFTDRRKKFVVEVPTNQTHLHNKQEAIDFNYGDYIFTIILIFVILTRKTLYHFRRVRKKLADIFSKIKNKFN